MTTTEPVCPQCNSQRKAVYQMTNKQLPKNPEPGDIMICRKCSGISVFTEDGTRKPNPEEMEELLADDSIIVAVLAVRMSIESNGEEEEEEEDRP